MKGSMMRRIYSIEKAREVSKALPELADAVLRAEQANWDVIELVARELQDGEYEVYAQAPNGVMVALMIPAWRASEIAVPGGEGASDLHITLTYMGDAADLSLSQQRTLIGVVGEVALRHPRLTGNLVGTGTFPGDDDSYPYWVGVEIPGLMELQADLAQTLTDAGLPPQGKGVGSYKPHVTVAYLPKDTPQPSVKFAPLEVHFPEITVAVGPNRYTLGLHDLSQDAVDDYSRSPEGWVPDAFTKAVESKKEDRYTLGPLYIPGSLDAHNEWTDTEHLQKSVWEYVRKNDRRIRLQHDTDVVAGECVEVLTWPFEVTVPMTKADGTKTDFTYPAGTPFMGTIWNEAAWELIKKGELRGYSIGGRADMIEVDLGEGDVEAMKP